MRESLIDLIKVIIDIYFEKFDIEKTTKYNILRKKNRDLYDKLRRTKAKFLFLIDILKATYNVINFL